MKPNKSRGTNWKDLTGKTFNRWTVLKFLGVKKYPCGTTHAIWLSRCRCGNESEMISGAFRKSQSCGCLRNEVVTTHGQTKDGKVNPSYRAWCSILQRCNNPKNPGYKNYGGRGIKVAERWLKFDNFYEDFGKDWVVGTSVDRIDNDGDYRPGNVRWASWVEQCTNKRINRFIEYAGKRMTSSQWAKETGIHPRYICYRLNAGWTPQEILTTPVIKKPKRVKVNA